MAVLQRNARSLLLLRLISKNQDVQTLELRALSQFLRPQNGFGAADLRPYSTVSGTSASPFRTSTQDGDLRLTDFTSSSFASRGGTYAAFSQAGMLLYATRVCAGMKPRGDKRQFCEAEGLLRRIVHHMVLCAPCSQLCYKRWTPGCKACK